RPRIQGRRCNRPACRCWHRTIRWPRCPQPDGAPGRSDALLLATTLGDWMTMAGHRADGVFWVEDAVGFTTFVAAGEDGAAKLAPLAKVSEAFKTEWASPPDWTYFEESCRSLEAEYQIGDVTWRSKLPPEIPAVEGRPPEKVRPVHLYDRYTLEGA